MAKSFYFAVISFEDDEDTNPGYDDVVLAGLRFAPDSGFDFVAWCSCAEEAGALRARDALAYDTLVAYIHLCQNADPPVPEDRLAQLHGVAEKFFTFPRHRLKTPGSTHGK